MIFLLSPSKTMNLKGLQQAEFTIKKQTKRILKVLQAYSPDEVANTYKIKGKLLTETLELIQQFDSMGLKPAIELYEGSVFKGLQLKAYNAQELAYLNHSVRILSAFYGLSRPDEFIKPYRLDMKHPLFKTLGRDYWEQSLLKALTGEDTVVSLASEEFSQLLKRPMVICQFAEGQGDQLTIKSTYAKIARGQMLDYAIRHQCQSPEDLKHFNVNGYSYQSELDACDSAGNRIMVFTRP